MAAATILTVPAGDRVRLYFKRDNLGNHNPVEGTWIQAHSGRKVYDDASETYVEIETEYANRTGSLTAPLYDLRSIEWLDAPAPWLRWLTFIEF